MKKHRLALIKKHRKRREKLRKLREKYILAKTEEEKGRILEKVRKICPTLSVQEFMEQVKKLQEEKAREKEIKAQAQKVGEETL
ncbi:hypothetical protein H5U35_04670 [Candidatus Aerophobetes bacterium]|nr:hypothetical protein [Candidatus Aerophobetes bacterium]